MKAQESSKSNLRRAAQPGTAKKLIAQGKWFLSIGMVRTHSDKFPSGVDIADYTLGHSAGSVEEECFSVRLWIQTSTNNRFAVHHAFCQFVFSTCFLPSSLSPTVSCSSTSVSWLHEYDLTFYKIGAVSASSNVFFVVPHYANYTMSTMEF